MDIKEMIKLQEEMNKTLDELNKKLSWLCESKELRREALYGTEETN